MNIDPEQVRQTVEAIHSFLGAAAQDDEDGWHVARYDPNQLLAAFPALKLRQGFELAAYHRTAGGNGCGMGLVVPVGTNLPEVPRTPGNHQFPVELPSELTGLVTEFLEPIAEPDAFWQASLFVREFYELVPFWHDSNWHDEALLLQAPTDVKPPGPAYVAPSHWAPVVDLFGAGAVVRFHTVCFDSVNEYTDRWSKTLQPDGWEPWRGFANGRWVLGDGTRPPH